MERPELCVLLAYAKRSLKTALLESSLVDDPYLDRELRGYFPPKVVERFGHLLGRHALRRELVATIMANDVVNSQGITFVSRLCSETGAEQAEVVRAYYIAREVTGRRRPLGGHRGARRHHGSVAAERADGRRRLGWSRTSPAGTCCTRSRAASRT